jgi:hypothetical protein
MFVSSIERTRLWLSNSVYFALTSCTRRTTRGFLDTEYGCSVVQNRVVAKLTAYHPIYDVDRC